MTAGAQQPISAIAAGDSAVTPPSTLDNGGRPASFFFGVRIMLGTILGRFSILYFRGLGLRIRVRVWVRVWVRVSVSVSVMARVRVSVVL